MKSSKSTIWFFLGVLIISLLVWYFFSYRDGNPLEVRVADDFLPNVGNVLEKADFIRISTPRSNDTITSPLIVTGDARGYWFFEATFPITVVDWDGLIIGQGYAEAQDEWMTEEFVPFEGMISFDIDQIRGNYSERGTLILHKANASGLPEHDDALEIPVLLR